MFINFSPSNAFTPSQDMSLATTRALNEEGGSNDSLLTTQAVGEEGGGGNWATTRALGEEGGGGGRPPMASTQAVGEEGGGATSYAMGEEGGGDWATTLALGEEGGGGGRPPIASTKALGEEGGGDRISTQAVGEEGGGFTAPEMEGGYGPGFKTNDVANTLRAANGYSYDNNVTQQEIQRYATQLNFQKVILEFFGGFFGGGENLLSGINKQLDIINAVKDNFSAVAGQDGNAAGISIQDLNKTAARDGNRNNVTQYDLNPDIRYFGGPGQKPLLEYLTDFF